MPGQRPGWFHVDGAYGGFNIWRSGPAGTIPASTGPTASPSIPHKWLACRSECGCALVRDADAMPRDLRPDPPPCATTASCLVLRFGVQQTRGFKALKLWLTLQQIRRGGYCELIERDIALARLLHQGRGGARPRS
ncbi:MAG: hypothetical protein IPK19_21930 [Chloroflexi bacterium]|nr:hypothetical protein [Chloroflexota bacterium]